MENANLFWERVFGVQGCPAHIWKKNLYCPKELGFCCVKCPDEEDCERKGKCGANPNSCSVGRITRERVAQIYYSKKWKSFPEFSKVVREEAKK